MSTQNDKPCCEPGCCDDNAQSTASSKTQTVIDKVREGYAAIATSGQWSSVQASGAQEASSCCGGGSGGGGGCCGPTTLSADQVAQAVGYSKEDLDALPEGANMGLSCGNPTALASLKAGEVVLDLGSGGGLDCFVAGPKVGATGRVIGVDMTPEMIGKARDGLDAYRRHSGLDNVEFRLGEIGHLPVADASVDVVISNCVLNLAPDKQQVWREIARVLKPGGRVAVSDLALLKPLPDSVMADVEALVGCVAGAVTVEDMRTMMQSAGLTDIVLDSKPEYVKAMTDWQDPLYKKIAGGLDGPVHEYVTSLDTRATKPTG